MPSTHAYNQAKLQSSPSKTFRLYGLIVLALGAVICTTPAHSSGNDLSSAKATYQKDRALCNSGQTNQDRATCLKEAGAAYAEAKRGRLSDEGASYEKNALARCKALPQKDRHACQLRIRGEGSTDGSVEEGGIYRQIETTDGASQGQRRRHHD